VPRMGMKNVETKSTLAYGNSGLVRLGEALYNPRRL